MAGAARLITDIELVAAAELLEWQIPANLMRGDCDEPLFDAVNCSVYRGIAGGGN